MRLKSLKGEAKASLPKSKKAFTYKPLNLLGTQTLVWAELL